MTATYGGGVSGDRAAQSGPEPGIDSAPPQVAGPTAPVDPRDSAGLPDSAAPRAAVQPSASAAPRAAAEPREPAEPRKPAEPGDPSAAIPSGEAAELAGASRQAEPAPGPAPARGGRHGLLRYTLLRLALLAAVWFVAWFFVTSSPLWSLVIALLVSGVLSFFLLDRQRDAASGSVAGFFGRLNARIDANTRSEDDL